MGSPCPSRIALVEDDATAAAATILALRAVGLACHRFASGEAFLYSIEAERLDLLILSCDLPDIGAADLLGQVRARVGFALPIIAVAAANDLPASIAALEAGADDCIQRPFAAPLLLAQVKAALRRAASDTGRVEAVIGHLSFQPEGTKVYVDGLPVTLTAKEYALALLLCRSPAHAFTREDLLDRVWGSGAAPLTRTLDVHISRIRSKLLLRPDRGFRLSALYGRGYRLDRSGSAQDDAALTPQRRASPSGRVAA